MLRTNRTRKRVQKYTHLMDAICLALQVRNVRGHACSIGINTLPLETPGKSPTEIPASFIPLAGPVQKHETSSHKFTCFSI